MEEALYRLCGGSVPTHQAELAEGYLTLPGGHRVGVGGRYLSHPREGVVLQRVSSLNLRIARARKIALPPGLAEILQGHFTGLLVAGEPDSGKTTCCAAWRRFWPGWGGAVAVIDERGEFWPEEMRAARPPVDTVAGLPKAQAVQMALRTLAPQAVLWTSWAGWKRSAGWNRDFSAG